MALNSRNEVEQRLAALELATVPKPPAGFRSGFVVAFGAVLAVATAIALFTIRGIFVSIVIAAFLTIGLDPLIRWFERHKVKRPLALLIVVLMIVFVLIAVIWIVVPLVVQQLGELIARIPNEVESLMEASWFDQVNDLTNGILESVLNYISTSASDPGVGVFISGGLIGLGLTVVDAAANVFFVAILTMYFVATYGETKEAAFRLVAASRRETFKSFTNRILENVGRSISGEVTLASLNAVYSTLLFFFAGVPGALLIGVMAFFITLIPLVGTVVSMTIMSIIAFIHEPIEGLIVLIGMIIYAQIEAYVFTPKIQGKAVEIPGSVVLISVIAGGALFGFLGALIAIPTTASILLVIREVTMPRKELT